MQDATSIAIHAEVAERAQVAVQHATSKRHHNNNGAAVSPWVSPAMAEVVAEKALAVLQAAPGGGTVELVAAVRRATKKVQKKFPPFAKGPLYWLRVGLVPPQVVANDVYVWSALLEERLTILEHVDHDDGEERVALLGDRVVWRHALPPANGGMGSGNRGDWYVMGGPFGFDRLADVGSIGPAWDRQGFTPAQWAVVWRYLACFGMFTNGPLANAVFGVLEPGPPCWAVLARGVVNPTWATLQEIGNWLTCQRTPMKQLWVLIAAGYRPHKVMPRRQLSLPYAVILLANKLRWVLPSVDDVLLLRLRQEMLWVFPIMQPPWTKHVVISAWTPARSAWAM
jgi:hypothetical protein